MSWLEVNGARWRWVEVDGAEWRWVHGLVIPYSEESKESGHLSGSDE